MKYVKLAFSKPYIDLTFINTLACRYSVITAQSLRHLKRTNDPIKFK